MRDNAISYEQSIQLESKLRELEAEKQIIQQQRDIANKEREKVVTESVSLKVSLQRRLRTSIAGHLRFDKTIAVNTRYKTIWEKIYHFSKLSHHR